MTKKNTKKALLLSVLSLVVCFSMLVGTTFAWFTDSVSSDANVIVSGNLEVGFDYWDEENKEWKTVEGASDIFDPKALWEPGYAEVVYFKMSNLGTLDLKYQFLVSIVSETEGLTKDGKAIRLSSFLKYDVIDGVNPAEGGAYETRAAAIAAATDPKTLDSFSKSGTLSAASDDANVVDEKYCALVVWMPTTVGNEANHDGTHIPRIELGLTLTATQLASEADGFGNDYDEDAKYDDIPVASVTNLAIMPVITNDNMYIGSLSKDTPLDTAYLFSTTEEVEDALQSKYCNWHADFVVSFDKAVASDTVMLAGQYDEFRKDWLAFTNEDIPLEANETIRLLDAVGLSMNYEELCSIVKDFSCGAANLSPDNIGTTMTVELRIYETKDPADTSNNTSNEETGNYITIGEYSYTFGEMSDIDDGLVEVKEWEIEKELVSVYDVLDIGYTGPSEIEVTTKVYTFVAKDTEESVATSPYKDYLCDFFVTVEDGTLKDGVMLLGNYGDYGWLGIPVPSNENTADVYKDVPLLGTVSHGNISNWTYEEIVTGVAVFHCGIIDLSDGNVNAAEKVTVELRMTNPETGETITAAKYVVDLKK